MICLILSPDDIWMYKNSIQMYKTIEILKYINVVHGNSLDAR